MDVKIDFLLFYAYHFFVDKGNFFWEDTK